MGRFCERSSFWSPSLSIESVAYTLVLAEQHGAANLKAAAMRYVTANGEAVTETEGWTYLEQAKPSLSGHGGFPRGDRRKPAGLQACAHVLALDDSCDLGTENETPNRSRHMAKGFYSGRIYVAVLLYRSFLYFLACFRSRVPPLPLSRVPPLIADDRL